MDIWQISPPKPVVDSVANYFMRYGVALLWPGNSGRWSPAWYANNFATYDWIKWFAETVSIGDAILLRTGPSQIRAIGLVAEEYSYDDRFDDVHGFDLQHCRRVRWCKLPQDYDFGESVFTRGRFSRVRKTSVCQYVRDFIASPPNQWQETSLPELPAEEPALQDIPASLMGIIAQAQDLFGLFFDENNFGEPPMEDELVAHFVVPFLRCLGWPPECIAVKWKYIDLALFVSLPRTAQNCTLVIEAKRLGVDVEGALEQAKEYVKSLGTPCDIVVTDGIRYRMYSYDDGFTPIAYANLIRLKQSATELFDRMKRP